MVKNLKLIICTFTRQQQVFDCGTACLQSILKYAGKPVVPSNADSDTLSLLDLHKQASSFGLRSRCVRMDDDEALINNKWPCILHVVNENGDTHFIVHYGTDIRSGYHLVGDPDGKLDFVSSEALRKKWVSRAALYFADLEPKASWRSRIYPWNPRVYFSLLPRDLAVALPLMHFMVLGLGFGFTLIVEKALEPAFLGRPSWFLLLVFLSLAFITLSKCVAASMRQRILISFSKKLDKSLYDIQKARLSTAAKVYATNKANGSSLMNVQKVHQAMASFIGIVLSDGLILLMVLAYLLVNEPLLALFEIGILALLINLADRFMPLMFINYQNHPNWSDGHVLSGNGEFKGLAAGQFDDWSSDMVQRVYKASVEANKMTLCFELVAASNIVGVLVFGFFRLQEHIISYESFLIYLLLAYSLVTLMTRICNQILPMLQAAESVNMFTCPCDGHDI